MVSTASPPLPINGNSCRPSLPLSHLRGSPTILKWGFSREKDGSSISSRIKNQQFRILANPNVSAMGDSEKEVTMVDPLEAKRLAAKQMQRIKAKEKLKRRHQIEAINGAWAMIGLTAGLVIEGQTGKGILAQDIGKPSSIFSYNRQSPSAR